MGCFKVKKASGKHQSNKICSKGSIIGELATLRLRIYRYREAEKLKNRCKLWMTRVRWLPMEMIRVYLLQAMLNMMFARSPKTYREASTSSKHENSSAQTWTSISHKTPVPSATAASNVWKKRKNPFNTSTLKASSPVMRVISSIMGSQCRNLNSSIGIRLRGSYRKWVQPPP